LTEALPHVQKSTDCKGKIITIHFKATKV